ncbi:MAG TPA: MgtC/SapB family protein [Candidatus Ornithomonoglobus intestinigallinarum]|uniref:MgtC/SapB family protein n=1 Tax=Candidatus Ornithomonoglobus intestinigallinarum TaxID=2840894 RepID=A0A9D1H3S3_9FIRM|nr:MgtC/SapB family protein [Candidatus Ornithomonoglobus intestinigallinarum]
MTDEIFFDAALIVRMLVSCICGIAIGFERKNRAKEAGIRTHCIVACASAMMMIISKYGFTDLLLELETQADVRLDPSRMAQGIVTGVGFIGAGIIYVQRSNIRGLTTAAGLWATSGIGMALGGGMYVIGISATVIILAAQLLLHKSGEIMVSHKCKLIKIYGIETPDFQDATVEKLKELQVSVNETAIMRHRNGLYDYTFYCDMPGFVSEEEIIRQFDGKCTVDITR